MPLAPLTAGRGSRGPSAGEHTCRGPSLAPVESGRVAVPWPAWQWAERTVGTRPTQLRAVAGGRPRRGLCVSEMLEW